VFVPAAVSKGVLPIMLEATLATRQMVKRSMKVHTGEMNAILRMVLEACQLAIKLLSNVTYGYTTASFSGRMPSSILADAIVSTGRATLQWAMQEVTKNTDRFCQGYQGKLEVVYGDTDSMFILAKGCSREEAFQIGRSFTRYITALLRNPMELKFEKIYHPCLLLTKKRYVGYSYESEEQVKPIFDAKGIETVRLDGCGVLRKTAETAIRTLFDTSDLSKVRQTLVDVWSKVLSSGPAGGVFLQDFVFAKEVRIGRYTSDPPGAVVVKIKKKSDPMASVPYRWRQPYAVVCGLPNAKLRDLVVDPVELLKRGDTRIINTGYYIVKVLNAALHRLLRPAGCDIESWYKDLSRPKPKMRLNIQYLGFEKRNTGQQTIPVFMNKASCYLCSFEAMGKSFLCEHHSKKENQGAVIFRLLSLHRTKQLKEEKSKRICRDCASQAVGACNAPTHASVLFCKGEIVGPEGCRNVDCAHLHDRCRTLLDLEELETLEIQKEMKV
jgi:DNA polymerase zeta